MKRKILFILFIIFAIFLCINTYTYAECDTCSDENKTSFTEDFIKKISINLKDPSKNNIELTIKYDDFKDYFKMSFDFNIYVKQNYDLEMIINNPGCEGFFQDEIGFIFRFKEYNVFMNYDDMTNSFKDIKAKYDKEKIVITSNQNLENKYYKIDPSFGYLTLNFDGRQGINGMIRTCNVTFPEYDGILKNMTVYLGLNIPIPTFRQMRIAIYDVTNTVDNAILLYNSTNFTLSGLSVLPIRRTFNIPDNVIINIYKDHKYVFCAWASGTTGVAVYYDLVTGIIAHNYTKSYTGQYPNTIDFYNETGKANIIYGKYNITLDELDNIEKFLLEGVLELDENLVILILYLFFIIVAEWKKDWFYFVICTVFSLVLGISYLSNPEYHYFYGLCIFLGSAYYVYLSVVYGKEFYKHR